IGGSEEFARSAKTMLSDVFGAAPARLEPAHALYQMPGLEIAQFRYRRKAQRRLGRDSGPALEAIVYKDRAAVFFSREDLSAALLGYQGMGVDGYTPETAFELVRNLAVLASGQVPTTRPATEPAAAARPSPAPAGTKVDVKGEYVSPNDEIGPGAIANMTANTTLGWQTGNCHIDVITNGFALTIDSGGGNALNYTGVISGTGSVTLLMGPSSTGFKDAPLQLGGTKPNTTTGKFIACKGRVQLEKPDGVDAISGDVTVGGQGFNDCLHWVNSNQIKDTATITVLNAGNQGGAYLSLNGCKETVAALILAANTTVKTDGPRGQKGVLTVKSLTVNGVQKPAGTYTAATEKWIDGKGKVVVAP
ncbi:MAG: hypothetical protein NT031_03305, partial [Planctomycetota bacterium]|nr:hypothetical protein [Planctomycetota bacterium]